MSERTRPWRLVEGYELDVTTTENAHFPAGGLVCLRVFFVAEDGRRVDDCVFLPWDMAMRYADTIQSGPPARKVFYHYGEQVLRIEWRGRPESEVAQ